MAKHKITVTGVKAMEKRAKRLGVTIKDGAVNTAVDRGKADLAMENKRMPAQKRLDADTVRQKGHATVLAETGGLKRSGKVHVRLKKSGVVSYAIRRHGKTQSLQKSKSKPKSKRAGRGIKQRELGHFEIVKDQKVGRDKVETRGSGQILRTITRDKLAGIIRAGDKSRGVPRRPYDAHPFAWHVSTSKKFIRKNLSSQLGKNVNIRTVANFARDLVEIAAAAGG